MPVFVIFDSPSLTTHFVSAGNLTGSTTMPSLASDTHVLMRESSVDITLSLAIWRAMVLQSSIALDPNG